MPSGGYGLDEGDRLVIERALTDEDVRRFGLQFEWFWAYASARGQGATPAQAAAAAYTEWDL